MNRTFHVQRAPQTAHSPRLVKAWFAVALIPVAFVIAFAWGYLAYAFFGYTPENADAPLKVDLFAASTSLAIALVPCIAAVASARKALQEGDRRAVVPLALASIAGIGLILLTALSSG